MWPFKVRDCACLVHQCLTQSSYSINICSVHEEPFNSWEHIRLQSNRLNPFLNLFCFLASAHSKESEHTEGALHQVKTSQWLQSLRLNIIFSSCLLGFRVLSFNSVFPEEVQKAGKNVERLSLSINYFWCYTEHGQNLNFLWSYELSNLPVLNLSLPKPESGLNGFCWLLISL